MGKYNYSLERVNARGQKETLSVAGCDSFDEAVKIVEKGAYDRELAEAPLRAVKKNPVGSTRDFPIVPQTTGGTGPLPAVPDMVVPLDENGNPI